MTLDMLYNYAQSHGIHVHSFPMNEVKSVVLSGDNIAINPNKIDSSAEEKVILAHEIGHCQTGALYKQSTPADLRQKHENKADRWAINCLVPEDELLRAFSAGCIEPWAIAEFLEVTEELVMKSFDYYISARGINFNSQPL